MFVYATSFLKALWFFPPDYHLEMNELMQIEQYTSSFDNMPNEVIIRILAQADVTTIKMVSLVNKPLRSLIADVLFGYVSIENTSGMQAGQTYFRLTKRSVRRVWVLFAAAR